MDFESIEDYKDYISTLSLDSLIDIRDHIDKEKHADRFQLITNEIERRKSGECAQKASKENDDEIIDKMPIHSQRTIRLLHIIKEAFSLAWDKKLNILLAMIFPFIFLMILGFVKPYVFMYLGLFTVIIFYPPETLVIALFMLTCHRLFIFGKESVPRFGVLIPKEREFRFFGWFIAVTLLTIIMVIPIIGPLVILEVPEMLGITIALVPVGYVLARLSLLLPATAADQRPSITWAWNQSRGNGGRLFLLLTIPAIFTILESFIMDTLESSAMLSAFFNIIMVLSVVFGLAFISLAYKELCMKENSY